MSSNSINSFNADGEEGSQSDELDKIIIGNAADLSSADFACYMTQEFNPVALNAPVYDEDT